MKLKLVVDGDLRTAMKKRGIKIRQGTEEGVKERVDWLKNRYRDVIRPALGERAAGAVGSGLRKDPNKVAGFVFSRWKRPRAAGGTVPADILAAYANGTTVKPVKGRWIAYPAEGTGMKKAPGNIDYWAASKGIELEFVPPMRGRPFAMLIERSKSRTITRKGVKRVSTKTRRGQIGKVWFILIKENRIQRRFNLEVFKAELKRTLAPAILKHYGLGKAA